MNKYENNPVICRLFEELKSTTRKLKSIKINWSLAEQLAKAGFPSSMLACQYDCRVYMGPINDISSPRYSLEYYELTPVESLLEALKGGKVKRVRIGTILAAQLNLEGVDLSDISKEHKCLLEIDTSLGRLDYDIEFHPAAAPVLMTPKQIADLARSKYNAEDLAEIKEPPCRNCSYWRPHTITNGLGYHNGYVLCSNGTVKTDFSCYKERL